MASEVSTGRSGSAAYDAAFPRLGDALTLYLGRVPAFHLTQAAQRAGVPAAAAIFAEALLAALVMLLFWKGHYWFGLIAALAVMLLSVVAMMLSRLAKTATWADRTRIAVEALVPLLWWWAWAHGLAAYGRPLEPIFAT